MKVELRREKSTTESTPGKFFVDGAFICFCLEDIVRKDPDPSTPENEAKVYGETAIPAGTYLLAYTLSARFKKKTLQLLNVPGYTGIRIHGGNRSKDTLGCPLAGMNRCTDGISNCAPAVAKLEALILPELEAGREVKIEVVDFTEGT